MGNPAGGESVRVDLLRFFVAFVTRECGANQRAIPALSAGVGSGVGSPEQGCCEGERLDES